MSINSFSCGTRLQNCEALKVLMSLNQKVRLILKQIKTNIETQVFIDSVVCFITARNYKDFPEVVALVEDATEQLGFAEDAKKKAADFAAKGDWNKAMGWANQWWQYQVKTADVGLRAKTYLEEHDAKLVK